MNVRIHTQENMARITKESEVNDIQVFAAGVCCGVFFLLALLAWILWIEFKKATHYKD